ncbi:MAG: hypothetical protein ABI718_12075 [Acidobacteriota bacterium]
MNQETAMDIARFLATSLGRRMRIGLGVGMIAYGISRKNTGGFLLAALGFLPLAEGTANVFLLGPAIGAPLLGEDVQ